MNTDEQLVGVKGWLLFLVFSLQFFGPLSAFFHAANAYVLVKDVAPSSLFLAYFILLESAARGLFAYLAGSRLRKRHVQSSVRYAITVLWIAGPISALIEAAVLRSAAEHRVAVDVAGAFMAVASALIWTMYLRASRRVKNTYYPKESTVADIVGKQGMTELMYYAGQGDVDSVARLIDSGADINARCEKGATALIYAIFNNKDDVAKLLVERKADTTVSTNKGQTARSIAMSNDRSYILQVLDEAEVVQA